MELTLTKANKDHYPCPEIESLLLSSHIERNKRCENNAGRPIQKTDQDIVYLFCQVIALENTLSVSLPESSA